MTERRVANRFRLIKKGPPDQPWTSATLFLLMSVFAQTLFTFVRCHLVALVLSTVRHII